MTDDTITISDYYLYRTSEGDVRIGTRVPAGCAKVAGPVRAATWLEARDALRGEIAQQVREQQPDAVDHVPTDPVFRSAHEAMTFAFRFAGQHSPKTPMQVMLQQAEPLGSGRGLSGLDGAGQSGMVLAALRILSADQRHLVIARYGDIRRACPCCGQPAPDQVWLEAIEALSQADELRDLPKQVRHAAVEKVVCRRKLRFQDYATEYGLSPRTLRHKLSEVRSRFTQLENAAMGALEDFFRGRGVLSEP